MDNLQRAKASRRGGCSFVAKLLSKAQMITEINAEPTLESFSTSDREGIDLILSQLTAKKCQLEELDQVIASAIATEQELEDEVADTEMYHFVLNEHMATLQKYSSSSSSQASSISAQTQHQESRLDTTTITDTQLENNNQESLEHTATNGVVSKSLPHTHVACNVGQSVGQFVSRLPKLILPTFGGDPLQFQTFWDSFAAAVHNDNSLTGVQKFHYLRAQLLGDASNVIDNLPLTDANYQHSVALLKERFGKPYKLVNAHMDALMNLLKPVNNLASLQVFHDRLESHMRALQSLGKSSDTYCAMLTPMVLGNLPTDLRKQFARDHNSGEWTIQDVMACILKEIHVLEVGQYSNGFTKDAHSTATSFHTAVGKPVGQREKREPLCTYCKGSHTTNQCTVVKDHQQCTSIVKGAGLCFNCLAHHRVSQCTSRRRCKQCNQKHHTSLCPPPIAPANSPQPPSAPVANHTQSAPPPPPPPTSTTGTFTTVTRPQPSFELAHSVCLLKTAIATVSAGPFSTEGRILHMKAHNAPSSLRTSQTDFA